MELTGYPFLDYINEDKSHYKHAKDVGYVDNDDLFLIGDSGGFLMNINPNWKFVNTELFAPAANEYRKNKNKYTTLKVDSIPYRQLRRREQYRRTYGFSAPCLQDEHGNIRNIRITGTYYNFVNYVNFISRRIECYFSIIGIVIMTLSICIKGDKKDEFYL